MLKVNGNMKVEDIFQGLKEVANPEDAIHMKAYMKDQFEFLGVKTPVRRKLSKVFFKKNSSPAIDWKFIHQAWENPYREMQYVVLDYLQLKQKALKPSDLLKIKKLAQTKPWWDTIDFLCRSVGFICLHYPETKKFVLEWSRDEDFWLRRLAIEHQLLQKKKRMSSCWSKSWLIILTRPSFSSIRLLAGLCEITPRPIPTGCWSLSKNTNTG